MAVGPRQERIGNRPVAGETNSAKPGPDFTNQIGSAKRGAESRGNRLHSASKLKTPSGGATGGERA